MTHRLKLTRSTYFFLLALILLITIGGCSPTNESFTVTSFNIRFDDKSNTPKSWDARKPTVLTYLYQLQPGILGVQEAQHHQMMQIDSVLTNHSFVGKARDDGKQAGEYSGLFIDTTRFEIRSDTTFWLSETPSDPSFGWDAAFPRVATAATIYDRMNKKSFVAINTHFDHVGVEARRQSALLLLKYLSTVTMPIVFMGDFNATHQDEPILVISEEFTDAFGVAGFQEEAATFNGFNPASFSNRIDYIFVKRFEVEEYSREVIFTPERVPLSDHWPITARMVFLKKWKGQSHLSFHHREKLFVCHTFSTVEQEICIGTCHVTQLIFPILSLIELE